MSGANVLLLIVLYLYCPEEKDGTKATEEEAEKISATGDGGYNPPEVPAGSDDLIGAPECGRGENVDMFIVDTIVLN